MGKLLGVNIDHIATLRRQRKALYPDLIFCAKLCRSAGADSIVAHLREDRRHIQDEDIFLLRRDTAIKLNLEMSMAADIVDIACKAKPSQVTIVPEKRRELTTEGGLDVIGQEKKVRAVADKLRKKGIKNISLFIEPDPGQIKKAHELGIDMIELHTGHYADNFATKSRRSDLEKIQDSAAYAHGLGMRVNAGHGLDYSNVCPIVSIPEIRELNIGYSIICHSLIVGLEKAVRLMKKSMD